MKNLEVNCKYFKGYKFINETIFGNNAEELIIKIKNKLYNNNYEYAVAYMEGKYYYSIVNKRIL